MTTHDVVLSLMHVLHSEISIMREPNQLQEMHSLLEACRDEIASLQYVTPDEQPEPQPEQLAPPTPTNGMPTAMLLSNEVPTSDTDLPSTWSFSALASPSAMLLSPAAAKSVPMPPEVFEPLPPTAIAKKFTGFVGFSIDSDYRACSICGSAVDPSVVATMEMPDAESLGSIVICNCVFNSPWQDFQRPFDEVGRPVIQGLMSM